MWNDADAEEDAHQTASSRVVPPYHASFKSSGQRTHSLVSGLEEPPTAVSRIRGSFCPVGGRFSSGLFSLPVLSNPTAATSEDPFPHLKQRQAMTYLRQLKSTFPLGPCLLMAKKKLLPSPSLNPLAGTECNHGSIPLRLGAPSDWVPTGQSPCPGESERHVVTSNECGTVSVQIQQANSQPCSCGRQWQKRVDAVANMCLRTTDELPIVSACNGDGGTWLSLGDQNVKRENCDEIGTNPQYSPEVHRPWMTLGSEQGRTSAPGSQSDSQNGITPCLGLFVGEHEMKKKRGFSQLWISRQEPACCIVSLELRHVLDRRWPSQQLVSSR
ncbi:hypothetical protein CMEL01_02592 [Colletotrichum melonis]|uniref:Uncharacterized protein n=1 Tax=Colletotrichum melonis TaxID=1209925 RepID=A0AAI9XTZ8_9PEZI|nr:hypothetical protein CMEL01_02592 [Colletotrichum melonis]